MADCKTREQWRTPTVMPRLCQAQIHVWSGSLDLGAGRQARCEAVLSKDERDRAARFLRDADRRRFVAARGILRLLLSHYAERRADTLEFSYGPNGKPHVIERPVSFNVSHARHWGLWAFCLTGAVGVDVEWTGRKIALDRLARRFLSERECADLEAQSEDRRRVCFFQCWTRKEAFVKALGDGLTFPLNAFDVTVDGPAELLRVRGDRNPKRWRLCAVEPAPEFVGAVAFEALAEVAPFRVTDLLFGL